MTARKTVAAKAALIASASGEVLGPVKVAHDDAAFIANLLAMPHKAQIDALLMLKPGEVAAIGGRSAGLAASCYEVIAIQMTRKHGKGWESRKYGGRVLTDLEKSERDALKADIDGLRSTFEANGYSNASQAIGYVRKWAAGTIGQKRGADANKARSTADWLKEEAPKWYRRLNKAEDVNDVDLALMDSIGGWLEDMGFNLRNVLGDA